MTSLLRKVDVWGARLDSCSHHRVAANQTRHIYRRLPLLSSIGRPFSDLHNNEGFVPQFDVDDPANYQAQTLNKRKLQAWTPIDPVRAAEGSLLTSESVATLTPPFPRRPGSMRFPYWYSPSSVTHEVPRTHPDETITVQDVYSALETDDPDVVIRTLSSVVGEMESTQVIAAIPATTFSEILRLLDPERLLSRYNMILREIGPRHPTHFQIQPTRSSRMSSFGDELLRNLKRIIQVRHEAGHKFSLQNYKYLLRCCRIEGDLEAATTVWMSMAADSCKPDLDCFNIYLATIVWADIQDPRRRYNLMVTPKNLTRRSGKNQPYRFRGHSAGKYGIRYKMTTLFNKMIANDIMGDEETFCLMILADAREGDVDGIKAKIENLWRINVDQLMQENEELLTPVEAYSVDSPFYPSETLLLAVAHSFSINNQVPIALRLIEFISQKYNIPIPITVWTELLEKAAVLTAPSGRVRKYVKKAYMWDVAKGKAPLSEPLPLTVVANLWNTFVSSPYNIQPTMFMYDKLITNLIQRQCFTQALEQMEKGRGEHIRSVFNYRQLLDKYQQCLAETLLRPNALRRVRFKSFARLLFQTPTTKLGKAASPRLIRLEREVAYARLRTHLNRQYLRDWCRRFLHSSTQSFRKNDNFLLRQLPLMLHEWRLYLPRQIDYSIQTGHISFHSHSASINEIRTKGLIRNTLVAPTDNIQKQIRRVDGRSDLEEGGQQSKRLRQRAALLTSERSMSPRALRNRARVSRGDTQNDQDWKFERKRSRTAS